MYVQAHLCLEHNMRISSFFTPIRRTVARLLPSRFAKVAAPKRDIRPFADFFVPVSTKKAAKRPTAAPVRDTRPFDSFLPPVSAKAALHPAQVIGIAERRHIRAKYALRQADLIVHQANRKYGAGSPEAAWAASVYAKADVKLGAAAGDLYASRILLGDNF